MGRKAGTKSCDHFQSKNPLVIIGVKRTLRVMSCVSIGSQLFSHASAQEVAPPLLSRPEGPYGEV